MRDRSPMAGSNLSLLDEADPNTLDEYERILDKDSDIVIMYSSQPLFPPQNPPGGQLDGDNRFTPDEKTYFVADLGKSSLILSPGLWRYHRKK
jgi:hypothetical protein